MKNLWNDAEAETLVAAYAKKGVERELALRVYTTRLLGGEPRLVLHGGGNTSVKTKVTDLVGDEWDVLCVKGSGWDMGVIEPQGLPAVKLAPLLKARKLDEAFRRGHGGAAARQSHRSGSRRILRSRRCCTPSCRTNSSTTRIRPRSWRSSTRQDSEALCRKVFGRRLGFVPYIKPGFDLAKAAAEIYEQDPSVVGLILDKHGIFTFGDDAQAGL